MLFSRYHRRLVPFILHSTLRPTSRALLPYRFRPSILSLPLPHRCCGLSTVCVLSTTDSYLRCHSVNADPLVRRVALASLPYKSLRSFGFCHAHLFPFIYHLPNPIHAVGLTIAKSGWPVQPLPFQHVID